MARYPFANSLLSSIQTEVFGEQLITTSNGFVAERKDGLGDEWRFFLLKDSFL